MTSTLVIVFYFIGILLSKYKIVDPSVAIFIWVQCEIISLILEPLCFELFIPWLHKKDDVEIKKIYKEHK